MLYSKKTWDAPTTDGTKVIKRGEIVEEPLLRHTDTEKLCELMPPFRICVGTLSYKQTPMEVSGLVVPDSKREVKKNNVTWSRIEIVHASEIQTLQGETKVTKAKTSGLFEGEEEVLFYFVESERE